VIPISDDNPQLSTPWVNYALIFTNVTLFFLEDFAPEVVDHCRLILVPADVFGGSAPEVFSKACEGHTLGLPTLLTSAFLHADFMHLLGNMWFLFIFGNNIEDVMGRLKYLSFYLLSAVFCGLIYAYLSTSPALGASGAVCAVMAAYYWTYPRAKINMFFPLGVTALIVRIPSWMLILYHVVVTDFVELELFNGADDGTAHLAHLAGYVFGFFLVLPFTNKKLLSLHPYAGWDAVLPLAAQPISATLKIINYCFFAASIVLVLEILFYS